ncbi:RNA polymerase sigma factor [Humisphaera borealis]|uniref:Sigma-70 family RNA polymerase sigma factor n=1 Tax=Humisphaera borealis TaxID=2807512 RepID=A0A7M2WXS8_9BACT|nr:sigma-70 family RNA polymerase sigma factor [Humisphaera borealis]QOV90219.1 sigma-70 family RNA polymerase sigma factor [Humisphaera borealis]
MAKSIARQSKTSAVTASAPALESAVSVSLPMTDEALLLRVRAGDLSAGDALVRRYAQPLLRYLQRLVGDDLAEELHQQTWMSVLDNLDKFDPALASQSNESGAPAGGFKAWLFRIATNKANDLWRSRGRERAAKDGLRLVKDQTTPWAGEEAQGKEMQQKLIHAINKLPESQRQVLALRYYSNMKFIDIAKLLGCPLNTALGRVHKAMIKLRQLMDE